MSEGKWQYILMPVKVRLLEGDEVCEVCSVEMPSHADVAIALEDGQRYVGFGAAMKCLRGLINTDK